MTKKKETQIMKIQNEKANITNNPIKTKTVCKGILLTTACICIHTYIYTHTM